MTGHVGAVAPVALVVSVAQPTTTPEGPRGEDYGKSAPVGLVVIILFFVAVFFLVRSMNKHLRRIPESFDPPPSTPPSTDDKPGGEG